jgi:arylamine N-acetyltransferase
MIDHPKYTTSQLSQYFDRIRLPDHLRTYDVTNHTTEQQHNFLSQLQAHQISRIPFENLSLHYSLHRTINVEANNVFDKLVLDKHGTSRGGYCMENNTLFHTVLYSLGFDVYMIGARVFEAGSLTGLTHCLNIVTLPSGDRYAVDTGFGPNETVQPVKLEHGLVQPHISPASVRLRYDLLPQGLKRRGDNKVWIYEHRVNDDEAWTPAICFTELEFLPQDIAAMNYSPQKDPRSIFLQRVLCIRFTLDSETIPIPERQEGNGTDGQLTNNTSLKSGSGKVNGTLILDGDKIKWRRHGEKVFEMTLSSDAERLDALERWYGIILPQGDKEAIHGTALYIPDKTQAAHTF